MRVSTGVQVAIFLVALVLGIYAVATVADGWAGWPVFGVFGLAAVGAAIAVNNPRFQPQGKKRSIQRDSSSRW
jgi:hypothetical protein